MVKSTPKKRKFFEKRIETFLKSQDSPVTVTKKKMRLSSTSSSRSAPPTFSFSTHHPNCASSSPSLSPSSPSCLDSKSLSPFIFLHSKSPSLCRNLFPPLPPRPSPRLLQRSISDPVSLFPDSKVTEASPSRRDEGWAAFRNFLAEINEAWNLFIKSQQNPEASERPTRDSDYVRAGFIARHSTQSTDVPAQVEISSNLGASKVIRVDQKRFYFDLESNNRGHSLRISEVACRDCSSIVLPLSGLKQFYEMVAHFVGICEDRNEGMENA